MYTNVKKRVTGKPPVFQNTLNKHAFTLLLQTNEITRVTENKIDTNDLGYLFFNIAIGQDQSAQISFREFSTA